jgi:hypothetical protein
VKAPELNHPEYPALKGMPNNSIAPVSDWSFSK